MGKNKTATTNTSQATATPEEQQLMQQQIDFNNSIRPYALQNYTEFSKNLNAALTGQQTMAQGLGGISNQQTQEMVNSSLRDVLPQ